MRCRSCLHGTLTGASPVSEDASSQRRHIGPLGAGAGGAPGWAGARGGRQVRMGGRGGTAARGPGPATATAPEEAPVEAAAGVVVAAGGGGGGCCRLAKESSSALSVNSKATYSSSQASMAGSLAVRLYASRGPGGRRSPRSPALAPGRDAPRRPATHTHARTHTHTHTRH